MMQTRAGRRGWCAPVVLMGVIGLLSCIPAHAQTADIVGTVTDNSGAAIPNATVTALNAGTGDTRNAITSQTGDFTFSTLPIGRYTIKVQVTGFAPFQANDIALQAGDRRRVNAALNVGSAVEQVIVSAAPTALQSDTSTVGTTISNEPVENLPTNGRNFISLVQLVPGGTRPDDRRMTSAVSINGQSTMVNTEELDGLDNNERIIGTIGVRPSIDAIQEFRVETNLYTAEVGRTAAGVINILTKSGDNQFHGSAYEFPRNDKLDGRDFFARTGPKPEYRQNQFGGSLGGPIRHDRIFFFGDYEGLRIVQGSTSTVTVPTLYEEQNPGDFSDAGGPVLSAGTLNSVGLNYFHLYELKAGYTRINNASLPLNYGTNASAAFGLPGVNYKAEVSALSPFLPSGYASVGGRRVSAPSRYR